MNWSCLNHINNYVPLEVVVHLCMRHLSYSVDNTESHESLTLKSSRLGNIIHTTDLEQASQAFL